MFGGLTRREVRLIAGLSLAFVGGGIFTNWLSTREQPQPPSAVAPAPVPLPLTPGRNSPDPTKPDPAGPDGQLDLNEATAAQLADLPSIGPAKADAIVAHREGLGGFRSVEELDDVPGIGAKTLDQLRPFLTVANPAPRGTAAPVAATATAMPTPVPAATPYAGIVRLNSASRDELMSLDGVGERLADRIIEDRITRGRFKSVDDLARVKGIGPSILARNRQRMVLD